MKFRPWHEITRLASTLAKPLQKDHGGKLVGATRCKRRLYERIFTTKWSLLRMADAGVGGPILRLSRKARIP